MVQTSLRLWSKDQAAQARHMVTVYVELITLKYECAGFSEGEIEREREFAFFLLVCDEVLRYCVVVTLVVIQCG